ncbi:major facilitator superfamily domain-containing protein [Microdochium trichocladiopsis]|uniref:Major facilitator superfamily domain-containing protein n=1 Tax=Microdochium trichocladiopsis TaxID=1682393 RepID=A0A9P8YD19_9PEZI|nr:major facilitator superfamily domain-containing protein [Microdochium trichocladiopsis]KAH7035814.1 major facilitator superfamily domain-containing protein [Microdochium trichocladiopsis]
MHNNNGDPKSVAAGDEVIAGRPRSDSGHISATVGRPPASTVTPPDETPMMGQDQGQDNVGSTDTKVKSAAPAGVSTDDAEAALSRVPSGPAYTVFPPSMIWWIVAMNFLAAFMSPMTANVYFTAIPVLSRDLGVTISQINLTVTTYTIFQGLAPMFFGNFGDAAGRRPAFIVAFTIFLGANIGLALQRDYVALLVLRMLQSTGASGTIALVYAVVADLAPRSERGRYMGVVGGGITMGPALGPVLGGILAQYLGWPAIFWFLVIFTVTWLVPFILAVPETARNVVGNGSIPPRGWNMTLLDYFRDRKRRSGAPPRPRQKIPLPNPLVTLKLLLRKEMGMLLLYNGALFLGFQAVSATLSTRLFEAYGFNELQLGLCYLPLGLGCTISSVANGYIVDWNYRRTAKRLGVVIDRKSGVEAPGFPIERVRVEVALPQILLGVLVYIGYAWSFYFRAHIAVPLVLSFFIGLCVTGAFSVINILLVDLTPDAPASATAANNLIRCAYGAISIAVIEDVIGRIGVGWAYSIIGIMFAVFSPVLWYIQKKGPQWREEKRQKMAAEKEQTAEENTAAAAAARDSADEVERTGAGEAVTAEGGLQEPESKRLAAN